MATSTRLLPLLQLGILLLVLTVAKGQPTENATRADAGFSIIGVAEGSPPPTPVPLNLSNEVLGIPGITQTLNGYDTALGNDPICWVGFTNTSSSNTNSSTNNSENGVASPQTALDVVKQVFPNPLVSDFVFVETRILSQCPVNNSVRVEKPLEVQRGERLRTLQQYNYTLHVELDLDTLEYGEELMTDDGNDIVALQVVVCTLGKSGFCSPFVHEQANYKDAVAKFNRGENLTVTGKKVKGDLHGGTHIHSPWVFLDMQGRRRISENVTVPLLVNAPGDYFVIGTVQLYTGVNGTTTYRWDISNALDSGEGRYIRYQAPAEINEVSDGVLYFSYVAIVFASVILAFLIGQTLWHRDHQVLKLSQGDFLVVFGVSALLATCGAFLLVPKNDAYCRFQFPLILIPVQLMYAITIGRLWRIHAVISPLLLEHLSKGKPGLVARFVGALTYVSFAANNLFTFRKQNMRQSSAGLKQQISAFQLACVVGLFALPQFIIQVLAFALQPQKRTIHFNDDESVGRATCSSGVNAAAELVNYGFLILLLLVVILIVMAHSSRKLPSLFNETQVIYDSAFLSMVLLLLGGAVIAMTDNPSANPDVEYLIAMVLVLSITLNSAVRIMLPKLKRVWKNEIVIVSKLVTDHHRKAREKQAMRESTEGGVSGLDGSSTNNYRFHSSFSRGDGDYDVAQTDGLVATYHSNSNEVLGGRSSMSGRSSVSSNMSDGGTNIAEVNKKYNITTIRENEMNESINSFAGDNSGNDERQRTHDSVDNQSPAAMSVLKEEDGLSNFADELSEDPSSQKTADLKADSGSVNGAPPVDLEIAGGGVDDVPSKVAVDSALDVDAKSFETDEADLEKAAKVASSFGHNSGEKGKKSPFRASGFLKNAMAKGLSWRISSSKGLDAGLSDDEGGLDQNKADTDEEQAEPREPRRRRRLAKRMVVTEDETPARRLVLKMLDLQDQLEAVNNKIMSGVAVTQEDWRVITKLTGKLDRTFTNEVEWEWEEAKKYEESLRNVMPSDMARTPAVSFAGESTEKDAVKSTKKDKRIEAMKRGASTRQQEPGTEETVDDDFVSQNGDKSTKPVNSDTLYFT